MFPAGVQGITVHYVRLRSGLTVRALESGASQAPPVMLLHGWGACSYMHRYALPAFAAAGFRAIAMDTRGHGLSDKPAGVEGAYLIERLVQDVRDTADALGLRVFSLMGQSLGGGVALRFAISNPERVSRLVLVSPVGLSPIPAARVGRRLAPRLLDRFARYLVPRWVVGRALRMTYGNPSRVTECDVDEYWAPSQFPEYARAMRALVSETDWEPLPDDALGRLRAPTMIVVGSVDRLLRRPELGAARIPDAHVFHVAGAGHDANEEFHDRVNREAIWFLSSSRTHVAASDATA
jgi:pimeloyl-ACP methyl ester carboxylesterase